MAEDMIIKIIIPFIIILLTSCGKSPFEYELIRNTDKLIQGDNSQEILYRLDNYYFRFIKTKNFVLYDENKIKINSDMEENTFDNYNVYLWMPEHGHGSYPISIRYLGDSLYELSDVYFTMPGYWILVIQNKVTKKEIKWPINL